MKIKREDINFLYYLYRFRCLSLKQVNRFFYNDSNYYRDKIVPMIEAHLIVLNIIKEKYIVSITQKGINLFQEYLNIPNETYNAETGKIEKSTLKISDVIVEDKYVNHQVSLNDFVLEFKAQYGEIEYYDEKYLSDMKIIRPDGLIRIGNVDLFLEQDMGTESFKQLCDKWNRYKRYLNVAFNGERKIVVLFILKCQNMKGRKALVRKSIFDVFSQIDSAHFEVYIGDKNEMIKAANNEIKNKKEQTVKLVKIMQKHNFKVSKGDTLKAKLGTLYNFYIAMFDKKNRLNYYNPNKQRIGKFTEFLVDFYDNSPISVLNKIYFHHKNSHNYDIAYSPRPNLRLINYLVIVNDIHELYDHLNECELFEKERVFFTTMDRLNKMRFNQAIFTLTKSGDLMTCYDLYFEPTVKEGNIKDYKSNGVKML